MIRNRGGWILALGLLLTACTSGGDVTVDLTTELDDATLDLAPDSSGSVVMEVAGAAGSTVSVTSEGGSSDIDVSFAPDELDGSGSSTVTVTVSESAASGTYDLTLTATADGDSASSTLTVEVTGTTVEGTVVDFAGAGLQGVSVEIQGSEDTSGPDGTFTIDGVTPPYDLKTYDTVDGNHVVHAFEGLSSESPSVVPFSQFLVEENVQERFATTSTATIDGALPAAVTGDEEVVACVEGTSGPVYGCDVVDEHDADPDAFALTARWPDTATASVNVHFLKVDTGAGTPVAYEGYAERNATVTSGGVTTVDLNDYDSISGTTSVSGSFDVPSGLTPFTLNVHLRASERFVLPVATGIDVEGDATFDVTVPELPGFDGTAEAVAYTDLNAATTSFAWNRDLGSGDTLTFPAPPELASPADGEPDVTTGTEFAVTDDTDRTYTFIYGPGDSGPFYAVTTTDPTGTLPETPAFPTTLPSGVEYTWYAYASEAVATPEEAGTEWLQGYVDGVVASFAGGHGVESDGGTARADIRTFTTE